MTVGHGISGQSCNRVESGRKDRQNQQLNMLFLHNLSRKFFWHEAVHFFVKRHKTDREQVFIYKNGKGKIYNQKMTFVHIDKKYIN